MAAKKSPQTTSTTATFPARWDHNAVTATRRTTARALTSRASPNRPASKVIRILSARCGHERSEGVGGLDEVPGQQRGSDRLGDLLGRPSAAEEDAGAVLLVGQVIHRASQESRGGRGQDQGLGPQVPAGRRQVGRGCVGAQEANPPAAAPEEQAQAEQGDVVAFPGGQASTASGPAPDPQDRVIAARRWRSRLLAKCSWATVIVPSAHCSPRSTRKGIRADRMTSSRSSPARSRSRWTCRPWSSKARTQANIEDTVAWTSAGPRGDAASSSWRVVGRERSLRRTLRQASAADDPASRRSRTARTRRSSAGP